MYKILRRLKLTDLWIENNKEIGLVVQLKFSKALGPLNIFIKNWNFNHLWN